jgi:hypothetical protein
VTGEEDCCEAELVEWEEKCELGELEMGAGDKSGCRPELSVGVNWANKGEYWKDLRVVLGQWRDLKVILSRWRDLKVMFLFIIKNNNN